MTAHHAEWLSLIEVSGPFLTLPVLERVFPQGLDALERASAARAALAREEWSEAQSRGGGGADAIHDAWVQLVLRETLGLGDEVLRRGDRIPKELRVTVVEHGETLVPDYVVVNPGGAPHSGRPRLLVQVWPVGQNIDEAVKDKAWAVSPAERMTYLCRATGVRLGLVTDGERWMLVDAPAAETPGYASWYAQLWSQEPLTLRAFRSLLGARRFFAVAEPDTLERMLEESVQYQHQVTEQLGTQVRNAVEVLVQAVDKADLDRNRELLRGVTPERLYEAALTVMMRLVFLFCAEERGLSLLGEPDYDAYYAVSTLRGQLREEADRVGVEVLERREDAWARLLASFRAVYGGIEHDALRLPALGGSLFDPDRFSFLEGRPDGTSWRDTPANTLPIDNRTVLHLLESLQLLQTKGREGVIAARRLSFRALDVEQIGHVYEGLLDHVAVRLDGPALGLEGTRDKQPEVALDELEKERARRLDHFIEFLQERTGRSASALRKALEAKPDDAVRDRLLVACGNDRALLERVLPYHALIREDVWGYPQVYRAGSFMVTGGLERRETGTHYTPKHLTEAIVRETLEPIVYVGPSEGKPREDWKLRSTTEILDLKVCDMAMGSAAFLVQACRWLAERLVEAWGEAEAAGRFLSSDGRVLDRQALSRDPEEQLTIARRLIAERCLYGVDVNPMAVELAKLSLWLVTLAKGRPFGFLDHNLRSGDSLLGTRDLAQIRHLHPDPARGKKLHRSLFDHTKHIEPALVEALKLRQELRGIPILDIEDVRRMARLHEQAVHALERVELVADLVIGAAISYSEEKTNKGLNDELLRLADRLSRFLAGEDGLLVDLRGDARRLLDSGKPERNRSRRPFHWPIEFPEVFLRENGGFHAIVGNPPFKGGQKITGALGTDYREYLVRWIARGSRGSADLVAYFFLDAFSLLRNQGNFGLLAVNTIAEGDTRQVGLEQLVRQDAVIYSSFPNEPWPGEAAVVTSRVHVHKGEWKGARSLLGKQVVHISPFLSDREEWTPKRLKANEGIAFQGSIVVGMGFVISEGEALAMIERDPRNKEVLFPCLNGEDLNSDPEQKPFRWVINFWDWPEERAKAYREPYAIAKAKVKPERDKLNDKTSTGSRRKRYWWLYGSDAKSLYHAIGRAGSFCQHPEGWDAMTGPMRRVLVCSEVTKYLNFVFVPNTYVFMDRVDVFATEDAATYGILQSSIHEAWARKQSARLETRLKYSPGNAFLTCPLPNSMSDALAGVSQVAETLYGLRAEIMLTDNIGLTRLYNRVHDPEIHSRSIDELREQHIRLDQAVLSVYEWSDIELEHDFHEVAYLPENDRIRFTISEPARVVLLQRLAELNRTRYEEEVRQGLHGAGAKKTRSKSNPKAGVPTSTKARNGQTKDPGNTQALFDLDDAAN